MAQRFCEAIGFIWKGATVGREMCRLVRRSCIGFSLASTKSSAKSEPRSSAVSRLGAFCDVTERVSWYPSVPLIKRAVFREPRPTNQ